MNLSFATMTDYGKDMRGSLVLFHPEVPETTLSEQVANAGMRQAHIAETEKHAHVTYFLNGGKEEAYSGEERILIDSRRDVRTHDMAPEMRAKEITDAVLDFVKKGTDFIVLNYANADMVGHTANFEATIKAVEFLDSQLARLAQAAREADYLLMITADHGNAEIGYDKPVGQGHTAHTTNPVPFILGSKEFGLRAKGTLADVAPTILELLEIPKPGSMTGESLIVA